jgi:hypothetical protein
MQFGLVFVFYVNVTVMFMVTVNYHPLMGFDVTGRPNPGEKDPDR